MNKLIETNQTKQNLTETMKKIFDLAPEKEKKETSAKEEDCSYENSQLKM